MAQPLPTVSVLLPVLDEAESIDGVLDDLSNQDYRGEFEIIVADGGSTDHTPEILAQRSTDPRITVIDNPHRRQAFGLNLAAEKASGEVLVRADGHTRYQPDYITASVQGLSGPGVAVGGRMNPVGSTAVEKAVAAAMNSPLTMGPARFHHATEREEVDTVYLGAFRKEEFLGIGGFRSFPSGSSEDADFYYRWRRSGRRAYVDPAVVTSYRPRGTWPSLARQYWRYGQGKAEMWWVNGRPPSWRPLAPLTLAAGLLAATLLAGVTGVWWPLATLVGMWAVLLIWVGSRSSAGLLRTSGAAMVMHLAYGFGMIWGLLLGYFSTGGLRNADRPRLTPRQGA
jgi:cellulose synthase/poly-beta-1,6-N-acetylglucosamine synthase-like glycosyltransferase